MTLACQSSIDGFTILFMITEFRRKIVFIFYILFYILKILKYYGIIQVSNKSMMELPCL